MSNANSTTPALYLIDAMSLVFQAFYAIRNLTSPTGAPTNAVFGFTRQIQKFLATYHPTHLVAVFDSKGPTFRHELLDTYKANRTAPPDEFKVQLPQIFNVLKAMSIPTCSATGFEADDLIGTLSARAAASGMQTVIMSADKDLLQLVNEFVSVIRSRKDDMETYGPQEVKARLGVMPEQVADYLAMVGDTSDNIPGLPGVGPKSAVALLEQFGSIDNMLANLGQVVNEKRRALIAENAEKLRLSQRLARIDCDVPLDLPVEQIECNPCFDGPELMQLYRELGFFSMIKSAGAETKPASVAGAASLNGMAAAPPAQQQSERKTDYRIVSDQAELERLVQTIVEAGTVAFDTETTSADSMRGELVGISLCCAPGVSHYVPVGHGLMGNLERQLPLDTVRSVLAPVMADPAIKKIAHNAKYDIRVLARHGMPVKNVSFDSMLASYLLNAEGAHGLKALAAEILGIQMVKIDELIGKGKSCITMAEVEIDRAGPYACADADVTMLLFQNLSERLAANDLVTLFETIEMPLLEVLDTMEAEGVSIDRSALKDISKEIQVKIDAVAKKVYAEAGREFNICSPRQVGEVLFREIGLKPKRKTGDSTSVEVLEELSKEHPLPALILEYRHLEKMKSTYVESLPLMVNPRTGRIHTSFNQCVAATGRLSSSNPNLQNIPIRTAVGRQIRRAFVPNHPGDLLLAADYSQIELRVLAHVTGDEALRQAFVENLDIHAQTASRIFGVDRGDVTEEMRSRAKVINFGVLYGMSAHRLSRELGIPHSQAAKFIADYFSVFPKVRLWMDSLLEEARSKGYVSTISGRRRMTPGLTAANREVRSNAERMAINMPIQGASADMIKIAMIALQREIEQTGWAARMVLQVHDELIFSLPEAEVEPFTLVVRKLMEEALPLEVPVRVDVKAGKTWAEC